MTNAVAIAQYGSTSPNKNRIINGAMVIDQRNAGAAVTTDSAYPVDRFQAYEDTDGAYSAQRDTTVPAGFVNSLKWTTTTADSSLSATQYCGIYQAIEGYNVADLGFGTANASPITLSFWVRSSLTGTFGGSFRNSANNRSYPFTYTISSANTFEYKTVTVAGDTSGTWLTDNGAGLKVFFGLGVGSTYSGTAGAWASTNYLTATGAVSVIGTLNATFYITGVQLEAGTTASPFEYRQYGTELALCQRYYNMVANYTQNGSGVAPITNIVFPSATDIRGIYNFPVQMRVAPSVVSSSGSLYFRIYTGSNFYANSIALDFASVAGIGIVSGGGTSGATAGQGGIIFANTAGAYFALSAEL